MVRFIYLTVGHTKFAPDILFSYIAKTFYNPDVFCMEMLHHIQQYATSLVFTSRLMQHWKTALEQKFSAIPGITEMHDIFVSKKSGEVTIEHRRRCFDGEYTTLCNYKYNSKQPLPSLSPYEPVQLSAEKERQLSEQHRRYIKQDVPHYKLPTFLEHTQDPVAAPSVHSDTRQKKKRQ